MNGKCPVIQVIGLLVGVGATDGAGVAVSGTISILSMEGWVVVDDGSPKVLV